MQTKTSWLLSIGRGLTSRGLTVAAFALVAGLWARPAPAQRGEHQALREELRASPSPDDGFPGLFDTQVAAKGSVVGNLPSSSLYVGLTRDLTLGTVLWSYLPIATSGLPSGSLHARYRLGSSTWFRSTVDALYFGMQRRLDERRSPLTVALLGNNTEFVLSDHQRLTVNGWLGRMAGEEQGVDAATSVALLGGTYSFVFARWAACHLTGLYLVSSTGSADAPGVSADLDLLYGARARDRLLVRAMFNFRAGHWLFGVGAARAGSLLPWLNIGFQIGG